MDLQFEEADKKGIEIPDDLKKVRTKRSVELLDPSREKVNKADCVRPELVSIAIARAHEQSDQKLIKERRAEEACEALPRAEGMEIEEL